jgi:hypothetical protein
MTQPGVGGDGRQWDVALSFAGAQREYVGRVAAALKARGVRCFYDADEQVRLWGRHLAEELPRIYARDSAAVVVFISADSAGGEWTRLERRAAFSRAVTEAGVFVLPARFDDSALPGLLPDVVTVDLRCRTPEEFADLVVAKLTEEGASAELPGEAPPPAGAVRVAQADLRWLGVHAAITVPGLAHDVPPVYVPRDTDDDPQGVRALLAAAARRGGFVLLVGGSSVGKTRCAAEAARAVLADWWLVRPAGPAPVAVLADRPTPRLVVWLDELQRYLDGEDGLTGAMIRALLTTRHPAVIVGTLWPDRYATYTTLPTPGGPDPYAREREVLDLATVVPVAAQFTPAEQGRAVAAAAGDRRLQVALGSAGYGLTQTLAAAPQLVARWRDAQDVSPYGWAVLTAAVDAARLGARAPLTADLLRAAAPGYCTSRQQAEAPDDWFEQAMAYATAKLHGAVAALSPAGTGVMGQIAGYTAADYLIQHATTERRTARVPASTWDALTCHIHDLADAARLAASASNRLLYTYAVPLYRHAADAGDQSAGYRLAELLAEQGDLGELRARADAGDWHAAYWLAVLLSGRDDLGELRARADAGDWAAGYRLAELLAERGDLDELRARADTSDGYADRLADLLAEGRDLDELRALADAGNAHAASRLAERLAWPGDLDELQARASAGDRHAADQLAKLLAWQGDLDELRARADSGDGHAAERLAGLLAGRGDLDGLSARADAGDGYAAHKLAKLLARQGDLDELRARADSGDAHAAERLAGLLAFRRELDELRARADAGDGHAAYWLAGLLADRGDLDELRARADAGDGYAAHKLAGLLADRGDLDGLWARADAGDGGIAEWIAGLLIEQGRREEAEQLRRFGLNADGSIASR